jgi:hypothetical protein
MSMVTADWASKGQMAVKRYIDTRGLLDLSLICLYFLPSQFLASLEWTGRHALSIQCLQTKGCPPIGQGGMADRLHAERKTVKNDTSCAVHQMPC